MSLTSKFATALLSSAVIFTLAACEDSEQKAQRKFETAQELIAAGDLKRADVEMRGIFDLTPNFLEARLAYANLRKQMGDSKDAYGQFLLAAEQHPRDFEARMQAAEMAATLVDFDRMHDNLLVAAELQPDNPRVEALELLEELQTARRDRDTPAIESVRDRARALLDDNPELVHGRNVLIDAYAALNDPYATLEVLDEAIERFPEDKRYYTFKLQILAQLDDREGLGEVLKRAADVFPDDRNFKLSLVRWYLGNGDVDGADAYLREDVARHGADTTPRVDYIQFLLQARDADAALSQLDAYLAEDGADELLFQTLRATTLFDSGRRDEGIAALRQTIDGREADDALRDAQVTLARMLEMSGQPEESRSIVETVLEADPQQVEALKLQAAWLVSQDRISDAILSLRTAMDQAPRDPGLNTLMADAHEREGNRDLMRENLQLAVEKSSYGASESLRYAQLLVAEDKYPVARDVLTQALRRAPADLVLLQKLAEVYLGMADWTGAEQVVRAIRGIGTPQAQTMANGLEATMLGRMQRTDESMELLRGMLDDDSTALMAQAAIIRAHLSKGDGAAARKFMDEVLARTPDAAGARFLNAALLSVEGRLEEATAVYRALLDEDPAQEIVWRAYVSALMRAGDQEAADAALEEGIAALPESMNLLWQKAGIEERAGDTEAAIEIYQTLYDRNSASTIVANNLASLITTYRDTPEDLNRAYTIARRLRGTDVPAFQDTYGWIAFRMGNVDEALPYLRDAAAALTGDTMVQEHYARALVGAGREADAIPLFERAIELTPPENAERLQMLEAARSDAEARAAETPN
ncbi:tetratricopeptide repeat protein [Mangrovicoccus algicola]|uniref:Tetratricopeptide repeat protein n=1 Tax=Mangrovicoccus algicola TaxID=2771008 RepID=A0A8J6Z5F6_9RHOB|nr:tetratricopeptide repeat protein [Mangrovicoccus algicola]MBE3638049.1 tetratricopeptide repeat protein [Mangrovicoccus algicola]